ncbi:S-adenosyl-L-methionine-dependent methyltransferase [Agrobacterium phage OLIVR4]|nr:S-adenosyl-L-methionine-dependent methyltransferase [Agrobacterium phage OLIVR4]
MTVVKSKYELKENELYPTETWVSHALFRHIPVAGLYVWEPAAGNHKIADECRRYGARVYTSDIAVYDREHDFVIDFFMMNDPTLGFDMIFTNPPYGAQNRTAARFARHALELCDGWVILVLTAKFDSGSSRHDLFRDNPRWHAKIVLTDRISWEGNGKTGTEDHAIFAWRPKWAEVKQPVLIYEGKPRN